MGGIEIEKLKTFSYLIIFESVTGIVRLLTAHYAYVRDTIANMITLVPH